MKIGFALPHQGPVATKDNMRLVATEAETMGYDSLWTNERLLVPVAAKTPYPGNAAGVLDEEYKNHLDHLTCMTYVSAITERVRLGVSVINIPWYNPVLLAKRLAAMDVLSNRRITVAAAPAWGRRRTSATRRTSHSASGAVSARRRSSACSQCGVPTRSSITASTSTWSPHTSVPNPSRSRIRPSSSAPSCPGPSTGPDGWPTASRDAALL